jgi:hypothetical protein
LIWQIHIYVLGKTKFVRIFGYRAPLHSIIDFTTWNGIAKRKPTQNAGGYFSMLKNWLLAMASFKGAKSFNFTF